MNESDYNQLKEKSWRRKLTPAEEAELRAWLAEHPGLEADWEADAQLSRVLGELPDAPVGSNFAARVLQSVEREAAAREPRRVPAWRGLLHSLAPGAAAAAVVVAVALFTWHEHRERTAERRAELVRGVKVVAGVPSLPSPEILQDFDTIRQMGATPGPDPELIALLK